MPCQGAAVESLLITNEGDRPSTDEIPQESNQLRWGLNGSEKGCDGQKCIAGTDSISNEWSKGRRMADTDVLGVEVKPIASEGDEGAPRAESFPKCGDELVQVDVASAHF